MDDEKVPIAEINWAVDLFETSIGLIVATMSRAGHDDHALVSTIMLALQKTMAGFLVEISDDFVKGKEDEAFEAGFVLNDKVLREMVADLRRERAAEDAAEQAAT